MQGQAQPPRRRHLTDRSAGVDWMSDPLTSIPSRRAKGRSGRHPPDCRCQRCAELQASAQEALMQKLPKLAQLLDRPVHWNLQTWTLSQLYARFIDLREELIAKVNAGEVRWPPPDESNDMPF